MSGGTPRRERKVVTVVFCDLVGFTAQAESLDPEDVEAILRPYHARVRAELERHGGTVEKFIGDAVMALFGAPTAHEDDPERAVRAALAIRDSAVDEGLELRVGITTGEALISLDASPGEGEGMASGDVVNTAARLQGAAPVNGILVDETTHRATRHVIEHEGAPPVEAKGKSQPVSVWQALHARSRPGVDVAHEARAQLVGREQEIRVLRDALDRVRQSRTSQLLTLVGVPGIGKSRLLFELRAMVEADAELITWRQGRCLAYGDGITLWALGEIVKAQAGIHEQDPPTEAAAKIHRAVEDAVEERIDAAWVESHLLALVGLAGENEIVSDRRGEAFSAWRHFFEALAHQRPLVLVIEDLHWADESLLDFLDELVEWVTDVPLLVVATARPELLERRPGWGGGKLNATTIALAPLSDEQTALLLGRLLDRPVLAAEAQRVLLERAGGNPLYAEQFAELFLEQGSAEALSLPESLQGIISARLDGLPQEEKELLRDASVIGKVFWAAALRREPDQMSASLHSLARKAFVRQQRRSSVEGESEFAFAHALVRDVAYGQIARADRAEKHRHTAEWFASLGRPEDHAEMLAHHWTSALELASASGQDTSALEEPARLALSAAGDRAMSVNAFSAAAAYYGQALALWPPEDHERPGLLARRARCLALTDDAGAFAALEEARDALLAAGDRDAAAEVEARLAVSWWRRSETEQSALHLSRAEELVRGSRSHAATRVLATRAQAHALAGDYAEAVELASHVLELADELDDDQLRALALNVLGGAKVSLGDLHGIDDQARSVDIAAAANLSSASTFANNLAFSVWLSFDMRRAAELFAEAESHADRYGDVSSGRLLRLQNANLALVLGHWDEARRRLADLSAQHEAGVPLIFPADILRGRARLREADGDLDGALADFRAALTLARAGTQPRQLLQHLGTAAFALEERGFGDSARDLAKEQLELCRENPHDATWALPYEFLLSRVVLELGDEFREVMRDASHPRWRELVVACLDRRFVQAADLWAKAGSPMWEARYRLRAAEELASAGRGADSEAQAALAADFYRRVDAPYFVERAEKLLPDAATA